MADDTNPEIIGGVGVTVGWDYSSLQDAFATTLGLAQQGGEDIANALASGAAGAADVGSDIADSLEQISPAADTASGSLDTFSGSAEQAGESSEAAGGNLETLAEQLTAVGEALVITEGLRELGSEALGAADSITQANIALTTITGSADTATETIEGLESLGMADGLAMPSLLTAATRMQQLLGPGADVVGLLGTIANGAKVMGTDIGSAADMFDRMAANGQVMSRSLGSVGLTMQQLATAVNQVNPALGATATNLTSVFKTSLDQEDRITALQNALQGLAGVAQQVADQTFKGQWQQLANAWEKIMADVGQAILPVVSDLIQLTKTEIVPFLQGAISEFTSLPGPVKDVIVAVGLLAAAVIPVTGALAAMGLAVTGIEGLLPALTGIVGAFAGASETAAIAQHAQAAATVEMGAAASSAVPQVQALALAEQQMSFGFAEELLPAVGLVGEQMSLELVPAIEGVGTGLAALTTDVGAAGLGLMALGPIAGLAALSVASLKDGWNKASSTFSTVSGVLQGMPGVMTAVTNAGGILGTTAGALKTSWSAVLDIFENYNTYSLVAKGINDIADAVELATGAVPPLGAALDKATDKFNNWQKILTTSKEAQDAWAASVKAAADAAGNYDNGLTPVQAAVGKIVVAQNAATDAYKTAKDAYDVLSNSLATGTPIYNGSAATAQEVATAFKNLETAATAAGIAVAPVPGSMDAITQAATKLATQTGFVVSAQQEQANEQAVAVGSMDLAATAYNTSIAKLDLLRGAEDDANAALAAGIGTRAQVITAEQNVQGAYAASQKDLKDLSTTVQNYITYMNGTGASIQAQINLLKDLATQFGPTTAAALGLTGQIAALQKQADAPIVGLPSSLAGLQSALTETTNNVAKLAAQMQAGMNVGVQYDKALNAQLNAQIALDQEAAILNTGLQGTTDATNLANLSVAAAQAKFDDLKAAWQAGQPVLTQLIAAEKALTTAQDNLNTATGQGKTLVDSLNAAYPNLTASANTATGALQNQANTALNLATELQGVGQAVQGVLNDFDQEYKDAGLSTGSGGSYSAPQGYTGQLTFGGGVLGGITETLTWVPTQATLDADRVAQEKVLYAKGYTPTAIAKSMGVPIKTVLSDLGVTDPNQTSSGASSTTSASSGASASTVDQSGVVYDTTQNSPNVSVLLAQQQLDAAVAAYNQALGSGASATAIQQALQLVNTAQAAYQAAEAGGGVQTPTGTTSSTTPPSTTSSAPVAGSTTSGTSAIDGGSYPAVTAHQASGEVWAVNTSGVASSAGAVAASPDSGSLATAAGATTAAANATSDAAGATSSAAGDTSSAAAQLSYAAGSLLVLASTLGPALEGTSLNSLGGGGTAVSGGSVLPATGSTGLEGTSLNSLGGGGTAVDTGPITNLFPSSTSDAEIAAMLVASAQAVEAAIANLPQSDSKIGAQIKSLEDIVIKGGGGGLTTAQENQLLSLLAEVGINPNGTPATPANLPYQPINNLPNYNPVGGPTSTPISVSATITVNGASNPTQVAQQVASTLVSQLRSAGARF